MQANPVTAVALDGAVDLERAGARLGWPVVRRYPYGLAFEAPDGSLAYLFAFGALVMVGHPALSEPLAGEVEAATGRAALRDTADRWELSVVRGVKGARARVGWDRVVLPDLTPDLVAVTALLLGQSAALERFEAAADAHVATAHDLATKLAATGRTPWSARPLVRRTGEVDGLRLAMADQLYILDRPEETWDDPAIAALYDDLLSGLELPQRHRTVLSKLDAVEGATQRVIDLWHGRLSNRLEWAIVLLIVFEIAWTLLEHALGS